MRISTPATFAVCAGVVALMLVVPTACEESNGFVLLPPDEMEEQDRIREGCQGGSNEWFSVGAMFVAFREALEACVIISVMVNILGKVSMPHFTKFVWYGVISGSLLSCLIGAGIISGYYAAQNALLSYKDKAAFSGTFSLVASLFLTGLAVQFLRFKDIEVKYKAKLGEGFKKTQQDRNHGSLEHLEQTAVQASKTSTLSMLRDPELKGTAISIFVLCFAAIIREGIELFVFLAAFASHTPPGAIAIAAVVGLSLGCVFGYFFLIMGRALKDLRRFLAIATVFMLFISAGLIALTSSAFKTVALINMGRVDTDFFFTTALYDIHKSTGDGHQTCGFFAVLRALVGYTHNPSLLWWITYLVYWFLVLVFLGFRYKAGTLFSKFGNDPFVSTDDNESGTEERDVENPGQAAKDATQSSSSDFGPDPTPETFERYKFVVGSVVGSETMYPHPFAGMPNPAPQWGVQHGVHQPAFNIGAPIPVQMFPPIPTRSQMIVPGHHRVM